MKSAEKSKKSKKKKIKNKCQRKKIRLRKESQPNLEY